MVSDAKIPKEQYVWSVLFQKAKNTRHRKAQTPESDTDEGH
jgi:hypothetical protein